MLLKTGFAKQDSLAAITEFTVMKMASRRLAVITFANHGRRRAEFQIQASVEHIQRTFPQASVSVLFAIANDAAFNLIDLFEAAILHDD